MKSVTRKTLRTLPLIRGKNVHFPKTPVCPICRRKRVFEPHSFAVLAAGALLRTSRIDASTDDRMIGFLDLAWHGAHNGGRGADKDMYVHVPVANDVVGGQFELYFCSPQCLRAFMNSLVDELERRMDSVGGKMRTTHKNKATGRRL